MAANPAFIANILARPDLKTHDVDITRPENNGQFLIVPFTDRIQNDTLFDGFDIALKHDRDVRWMYTPGPSFIGWYIGSNRVLMKIPNVSWAWLRDAITEETGRRMAGLTDPRVSQAITVTRNAIQQNTDRIFQYYLLRFPDDMVFDNSVFTPNEENGKIKSNVVPLNSTFDIPDPNGNGTLTVESTRVNCVWQIATAEEEPRYAGNARAHGHGQSEHEQQMAALLAQMAAARMNP